MDFENCEKCVSVSGKELERSANMCFDGQFYYFLIQDKRQIVKTDLDLHILGTYQTNRQYYCMCYDYTDHCFWAACYENCCFLYRLDCQMKETDIIRLTDCPESQSPVTGISYNCCNNTVILSYCHTVASIDKCSGRHEVIHRFSKEEITGILSLCPLYLVAVWHNDRQYIYVIEQDHSITEVYNQCTGDTIRTMLFHPYGCKCDAATLDILTLKNGECPCIKCISISQCTLNCDLCSCNCRVCERPCPPPCPPPAPQPVCCCDIIESIALIEASISHILNAEGEKLQKTLECTNDIDTILCVNQSITDTIIHITGLEHVLYSKLLAAYKLCLCKEKEQCCCSSPEDCLCKKPQDKLDIVKSLCDTILTQC